ncbi:ATP-binding protein [Streptomyces sp. NPDC045251]|uniref:sensor histidine kinase n=1 Tax=unclassified Streptomyces TaxID=2593676 RepID=UPI0033D49A68
MTTRLLPLTERGRLTALYGGLLLLAGLIMLGVIYLLVQAGLDHRISEAATTGHPRDVRLPRPSAARSSLPPVIPSEEAGEFAETKTVQAITDATLGRLLTVSALTFTVFALGSVVLAWWMAGRVLRPLSRITATARRLSGENLHQRIALTGPPGELKELADTFDQMLERLEQLVTAQQRFAANAAHELRTPLTVQRAAAEIGLADPDPENIPWIRQRLIDAAHHSEQLIDSLLLLATTDQGLDRSEPVHLEQTTAIIAADLGEEARHRGITVTPTIEPTLVNGDPTLLAHLVRNLLNNALRYNHHGGNVTVRLTDRTLTVTNTGPVIPPDIAPLLFEPFRRMRERTHAPAEGTGLGLSIVASIARAHHTRATAQANPTGGLTVTVHFPD